MNLICEAILHKSIYLKCKPQLHVIVFCFAYFKNEMIKKKKIICAFC